MDESNVNTNAIAIVGMSGRFPGAADVQAFWANLLAGLSGTVAPTDQDLDAAGVPPQVRTDPAYVRATGALEGIEEFDAQFFGLTPREAQLMDPQQRLFLECAWHALEDSGNRAAPGSRPPYSAAPAPTATCCTTWRRRSGSATRRTSTR